MKKNYLIYFLSLMLMVLLVPSCENNSLEDPSNPDSNRKEQGVDPEGTIYGGKNEMCIIE